jgi:D,D-heptose 1,7-bisphosphate phosphatase
MKIVILAGGKGKRMGLLTKSIPKPMVLLAEKPILEYQLELAKKYGFRDITILTGYQENVIRNHFQQGNKWDLNIDYRADPLPLGTAGAVKNIESSISTDFLLFYGDTVMDLDLHALVKFHKKNGSVATLVVHPNDHPYDSDLLEINDDNRVTDFHSKPHKKGKYYRNLVNAALYILSPKIFSYIEKDTFTDFGKDIFPKLVSAGLPVYAYNTTEYIKDVGTIKRLHQVEEDYLNGKIRRLNKSFLQKAIFIDRDGVINDEMEELDSLEKFHLLPGVEKAVLTANKSDYLAVVVTNQPVVAKGFADEKQVKEIHEYMEHILGENRAYLDRIFFCPHHPEQGHTGERKEYKILCNCRKPSTGMIEKAVHEMNIDVASSFIIGDRTVDIMTGINSGLHTILVRTGYAGEDMKFNCRSDFIFQDLKEAVQFIVYNYDTLLGKVKACLPTELIELKQNPVIVVGGQSRSGKSTLSTVIRKYLEQVGKRVKILELDNLLLSKNQRVPNMNVRDRYRFDAIEKEVEFLLSGKEITLDRYDPKTREVGRNTEKIVLNAGEILLIDGVVALDHTYLRDVADVSFFTCVLEELRKKRFYDFYHYKLLPEGEIENLYNSRLVDEVGIINQSKKYADHIINMEYSA